MIENGLKELAIKQGEQKKANHFNQIERRIKQNQQQTKWQVRLVTALVCILALFLVSTTQLFTPPEPTSTSTDIQKAYIMSGEGNPYSSWQVGVRKVVDVQWIQFMTEALEGMQLVEEVELQESIGFTMRLHFQDSTQNVYKVIYLDDVVYLINKENNQMYKFNESSNELYDKLTAPLNENVNLFIVIVIFTIVTIVTERIWNKKDEYGNKQPKYSHVSQSVLSIGVFALLSFLILFVKQIHFFVIVAVIAIVTTINCWIEAKVGKSINRQLLMIMSSLQILILMAMIFYYQ